MTIYYDRDGKPLTFGQFVELTRKIEETGDTGYRQVALDLVAGLKVSTVWLGVDTSGGSLGGPLIFETLVSGPEEVADQTYYSTLESAKKGHEATVARLRERAELHS